jgi:hypothetical protein
MADTAPAWRLLEAAKARLQLITIAGGARTDVGTDVRTEPGQFEVEDGPRITLYSGSKVRPDGARARSEREFTLIVEVMVPFAWETAQASIVAAEQDVEDILDEWLPMRGALPLTFQESVWLDRPDGVPAMVSQMMFGSGWRK